MGDKKEPVPKIEFHETRSKVFLFSFNFLPQLQVNSATVSPEAVAGAIVWK